MPFAAVKIADSIQQGLNSLIGFIPNVIGFLIILLIGYIIARIAKTLITKGLQALKVDRHLHDSDAGQYVEKISPGASPSKLIATVVFWFIFLFAISAAVGALKIATLTLFIAKVQAFLPNIIVAVLIFVIAAVIAGAVGGVTHKLMGDTPTGKIVRAVVPGLILAIATFMVLNQLHIAPAIVTITYAALIGMLALAGALAFGLGGRDLAAKLLSDAYDKGQENKDQVKDDMRTGRDRAEARKDEAQTRVEGGSRDGVGSARPQQI